MILKLRIAIFVSLVVPLLAHAQMTDGQLVQTAKSLFGIIPKKEKSLDAREKVELGRQLFFDYRLSKDGSTACVRCHQPQFYSTDRLTQSMGFNNNKGARNAQSILNLRYQTIVHWRGDRASIEEQALKAFTVPLSLGNGSTEEALERLRRAGYADTFKKVFPQASIALSLENAAAALGAYQRDLTTRGPFDAFMEGQIKALSFNARRGLQEFITVGCVGCHSGPAVGGRSMQKFGVFQNYWSLTKSNPDKGRFDATNKEEDMYVFKVPSLRNISETAPYFHDGSAKDLETAIRWMAKLQLNKDLSDQQVTTIKAFLESLKGELPKNYREAPQLSAAPYAGEKI